MIEITKVEVTGWESAIRGMRNPLNSWDRSDSYLYCTQSVAENGIRDWYEYHIGENDLALMKKLAKAGSDHAKYRRFIVATFDLLSPLYFLKEFDTYKVGTVSNSTSTMHKIHAKEFTIEDFSTEHLTTGSEIMLRGVINLMNQHRVKFNETKDKSWWYEMIQLLPSSYNQLRTVQVNYEVLANMYKARKNHKLDEWRQFCNFIEMLPYSEIITGVE